MKLAYNHRVDPEDYIGYPRRYATPVTRADLGNRVHFSTLRHLHIDDRNRIECFRESLDLYTKKYPLGDIISPKWEVLFTENITEFLEEIKKRDLYLTGFWGYVPGSDAFHGSGTWGQFRIDADTYGKVREILGRRFLGFSNGEQDGRYLGRYALQMRPATSDRKKQYVRFVEYFEKYGHDQANVMEVCITLTYSHYFAKEGHTVSLAAETAQALPNTSMYYAYLRGAGKQYGILWEGGVSVFNRWGFKNYYSEKDGKVLNEGLWGPSCGTSLDLMKRLTYILYMYNCEVLGYEMGWLYHGTTLKNPGELEVTYVVREANKDQKVVLTPIGEMARRDIRFVEKHGYAGVMHTPVAFMQGYYDGWIPPRHLYSTKTYTVWGNVPYNRGDHQIHALFEMVFPGYEDSGFFHDERGFLTPTPYGDLFDVLLSDARSEVLDMYNLVVLTGGAKIDLQLHDKLRAFVEHGGTIVLSVSNIETIYDSSFLGIQSVGPERRIDHGEVRLGVGGRVLREDPFDVCPVTPIEGVTIIAEEIATSIPVIIQHAYGQGRVVLITVPHGLTAKSTASGEIENVPDKRIPQAYDLLHSVKAFLGDEFARRNLVRVDGEGIQYLTNLGRREDTVHLTLSNNSRADIPCRISLHEGKIKGVTNLFSDETIPVTSEEDVVVSVGAGDIEILELTSETPIFQSRDKVRFSDVSGYLSLGLPYDADAREAILHLPTFDQLFDSVKLDARYLRRSSKEYIQRLSRYFSVKGVKVSAVDFCSLQNRYPDLNLFSTMKHEVERSMQEVTETIEKTSLLGCPFAIMTTSINAQNNQTPEEMDRLVTEAFVTVAEICEKYDVEVLITATPPPRWFPSTQSIFELVAGLGLRNVAMALNLSHCIIVGENPKEMYDRYGSIIKVVLLSAPFRDPFGQFYDSHQQAFGSPYEDDLRELIRHIHANGYEGRLAVDFDMDLASDFDRLYAEYKLAQESIALGRHI